MQLTTCKRVAVHLSTMPQLEARLHRLRSVDEQHQGRRSRVDGQKARLRVRPTISACAANSCSELCSRRKRKCSKKQRAHRDLEGAEPLAKHEQRIVLDEFTNDAAPDVEHCAGRASPPSQVPRRLSLLKKMIARLQMLHG